MVFFAVLVGGLGSAPVFADTLNGHTVVLDGSNKIIPWTPDPTQGYDTVITLAWNYLLNDVPVACSGKPAYYCYSYLDPDTQQPQDWPFNPAGMYAMLTESALKYYQYSGNRDVVTVAENVATWHLQHGMTLASDSWASVPYAEGDAGSLTYQGAAVGNTSGLGDGQGYLEPDKIGELGYAWLTLYQFDGNTAYRDAAIQCANVLAAKIRAGDATHSPWPFRVNAKTGAVREEYTADAINPIRLFDLLIKLNLGNTANYQTARNTAWTWLKTYPLQNNVWANYFEDNTIQPDLNDTTQYTALMTARYLMERSDLDASWQSHVQGILNWVLDNYATQSYGANTIEEQAIFAYPMGSHTSRYASVNAMLYELTGNTTAQQEAIRSFNWATYMARSSGVVIDGPDVNHQWFTDGYADYVRHFLTGMGAMPTFAPAGEDHLLRSTSIVKSVTYSSGGVSYATAENSATEVLRISFTPTSVLAGGVALSQNANLNQQGYTFDSSTGILRIRHDQNGAIQISSGGADFALGPASGGSTNLTVTAGQTATYNLQASSISSFSGTVALTCAGAPNLANCTVAPSSVNLDGSTPGAFTVTVTTTAHTSAGLWAPRSDAPFGPSQGLAGTILMASGMAMALLWLAKPARRGMAMAMVALFLVGLSTSCGGGSSSGGGGGGGGGGSGGTTSGTYILSVTGTESGVSHALNLTLKVN
ncbi:MAG: hypothetical protein JST79_07180 [Acidobacteria bacterium]|nr:hypothetical protein [Acidobacteriota bacterium]